MFYYNSAIIHILELFNILGKFHSKLEPFFISCIYPDILRKLQLYSIDDPAIPGAMNLSDPASPLVFILPRVRLPRRWLGLIRALCKSHYPIKKLSWEFGV